MSSSWDADALVNVQSENVDRYRRNFLKQAVCEFRFPTLLELGGPRPPASFVTALRKEYPHLELGNEVTLGIGTAQAGANNTHIFKSNKMNWVVSLKQSSLTIETTSYTVYAQFKDKVSRVLEAAAKIIDTDFFTRVGLRYINLIDQEEDPVDGWVNPELVAPLLSQHFSGISEYAGKLQVKAEDGGCLLQHGIRVRPTSEEPSAEYVIDVDAFRNEVPLVSTSDALDAMHRQAFNLFDWAIGPKAREYLSTERGQ